MAGGRSTLEVQVGGGHYKGLAIQTAVFLQLNRVPFCEANAIKYLVRHREKGRQQDLQKAIHYTAIALELEYGIGADGQPIDPDVTRANLVRWQAMFEADAKELAADDAAAGPIANGQPGPPATPLTAKDIASRGGRRRAEALTVERRREIAKHAADTRWGNGEESISPPEESPGR